jgi:uncharacterized membrane protein YvlD (DUF360 family)
MLASQIVPEFYVSGFWAAFFFSIIVSLINALFISKKSEEKISK